MKIEETSIDVNNVDIDRDGKDDHLTFRVTQTDDQSFSVRTFVDTSKDGFGKLNSDTTRTFANDTLSNWGTIEGLDKNRADGAGRVGGR